VEEYRRVVKHAYCKVVVMCLFFACNLLLELWRLLQSGCDVSLATPWPCFSRRAQSCAEVPAPMSFLLPLSSGFFILSLIFELPQRFLFGLRDDPIEKERVEIFSDVSGGGRLQNRRGPLLFQLSLSLSLSSCFFMTPLSVGRLFPSSSVCGCD
jgi:hypothetical protein